MNPLTRLLADIFSVFRYFQFGKEKKSSPAPPVHLSFPLVSLNTAADTFPCFLRPPSPSFGCIMVSLLPRAPYLASLPKSASSSLRPPPPAMLSSSSAARAEAAARPRKLPVLLFDVMDTLVRDPFYHHIPAFFKFRIRPPPRGPQSSFN